MTTKLASASRALPIPGRRSEWLTDPKANLMSGLVVALALIPEAISFSIIAGVDPKVGLYASFSIAIVIWMRIRGTPFHLRVIRDSMWGGIALGADIALFFSAVKLTSIVNATIIGSLQPIVVGVIAARGRGASFASAATALAGAAVLLSGRMCSSRSCWRWFCL